MSDKPSYTFGCGGSALGLLGVVFAVCKILGFINWSWWIVLMPFYLPVVIGVAVFTALILLWIIANINSSTHY